jgi:hypothetical protein
VTYGSFIIVSPHRNAENHRNAECSDSQKRVRSDDEPSVNEPRKKHAKLKGFARCVHTCEGRKCQNPTTNTLDWPREGGAVKKHAKSQTKHPKCSPTCEGWLFLQGNTTETKTAQKVEDDSTKNVEEPVGEGAYHSD